jgi:hypothetical protein
MTENHGVPGSNPGPATPKLAAKSGKRRSLDRDVKKSPQTR